jgi:hypothetical protein
VVKVLPPSSPVLALPGVDQQREAIAALHLGHHGADPVHHRGATGPRLRGGCERADIRERGAREENGGGVGAGAADNRERGRAQRERHGWNAGGGAVGARRFHAMDGSTLGSGAVGERLPWKDSRIWRGGSAEECATRYHGWNVCGGGGD